VPSQPEGVTVGMGLNTLRSSQNHCHDLEPLRVQLTGVRVAALATTTAKTRSVSGLHLNTALPNSRRLTAQELGVAIGSHHDRVTAKKKQFSDITIVPAPRTV